MACHDVTTLEQAEATLPSSVLPIKGLRRNADATLTDDARTMIIDGLKSRGVDVTDPAMKKKLIDDLMGLLCSVNKQYQFLLKELFTRVASGAQGPTEAFLNNIKEKNLFMLDTLSISRHIAGITSTGTSFIEGWQNSVSTESVNKFEHFTSDLAADRAALDSGSYLEMRKHMVQLTSEKNKVASNNLGMYGFLNLVAIGLIIYVAGIAKDQR